MKKKITESQLRNIIKESIKKCLTEMVAYHGSSVQFQRFDLSQAHSGEGGTMYGFGVYVTTNPKTAEYYIDVAKNQNGRQQGFLYTVQIPDENGRNYFNIEHNEPQVYDYIMNGLIKLRPNLKNEILDCLEYCKEHDTLMWLFQSGCGYAFDEKELSELLSQLGYVGCRVPVGYQDAGMGQTQGYNYTIFSDKNVKIIGVQQK